MVLMPPALANDVKSQASNFQVGNLQPIQYDYLKRLIKQLEDEAIEQHRIAKERKNMNTRLDEKAAMEKQRKDALWGQYKDGIRAQMRAHSEAKVHHEKDEKEKPHFDSPHGYPPHPEPTDFEQRMKRRNDQETIKTTLDG